MKTIAILYYPRVPRARPLAKKVAAWIERREAQACVCPVADASGELDWQQTDLLVTLGGDGSILRAAWAAAPHGTPILGINLGHVGFLAETEPETWRDVLTQVLAGDYWIEERMMLRAAVWKNGEMTGQAEALNEIVAGRGARAQVVHLHAEVDGGYLATYAADSLIVATPTGSTAYALAAGGPVMPPQLRNILLVPSAPHLSLAQSIVLSEGATVRITVDGGRPAVLTVDGKVQAELQDGDMVTVEASPHVTRFARVQDRMYFYNTLVARLMPRNWVSNPKYQILESKV